MKAHGAAHSHSRERTLLEELRNVSKNQPLFAGDTISHATSNEIAALGWAKRNHDGDFVITDTGRAMLSNVDRPS